MPSFAASNPPSRIWAIRKAKLIEALERFSSASPVMTLWDIEDVGEELRAVVQFDTDTLTKPAGQEVVLAGPVVTGIRYHQSFLSQPPIPWEIVTILMPMAIYHPNVNPNGGLCLGHPLAGVPMDLILHMTWAGLVMNTRLVTTTDWRVFNPAAAAYVRSHSHKFPLTERGLLEPLPAKPAENTIREELRS